MKKLCFAILLLSVTVGYAMPIASSARSMMPAEIQQLIGVDYRAIKDSPTAMALKQQVLPDNIKQAEVDLKAIGISSDNDLDQLNVVSFRTDKKGIQTVYVAAGSFSAKAVIKKMKIKKIASTKYGSAAIYPMGDMVMTFLDENTLAFGSPDSLHSALDTQDGKRPAIDTNSVMTDQMAAVDGSPVWSILDQKGTQAMMFSALGDASKVADYDTLKKRILASSYTMNFSSGVNFDLTVVTADSMTAATLSSIVKAGMLYKKMSASPAEKTAIDATTVDSDSSNLLLHFKSDDQKFQALMHSPLFAAVSH
jgi:malic enzyme